MVATAPVGNRPTIADSPRRHVLFQHFEVAHEDLGQTITTSFPALYRRIGEAGVVPAGPPFVIYHTSESPWKIDVCAPVATEMSPSADFQYRDMPAGRVVSLLHIGPYDTLGLAYDAVHTFIRENNLEFDGPPREFYLSPPETPPDKVQTIVEWPIR